MHEPLIAYFLQELEPAQRDALRARLDDRVRVTGPGVGEPDAPQNACHILVAGSFEPAHLTGSPALHTVIIPWAGLPARARTLLLEQPQLAVHNSHYNADPVAEYTLMLLLAAAKRIVPLDAALRRGDWRPRYRPNDALMLAGRHALVLGYGAIGRRVAQLCRAIGMRVSATRRSSDGVQVDDGVNVYPPHALADLLPQADALICCLPLTDETRGLIGAAELALLPQTAIAVNIGRGAVFDEAALYTALRDRTIWAAGLDVWYHYPADETRRGTTHPSHYPFGDLDNVVLSPHHSSSLASGEDMLLLVDSLAGLLNAAARGEALPNRVDVARGY